MDQYGNKAGLPKGTGLIIVAVVILMVIGYAITHTSSVSVKTESGPPPEVKTPAENPAVNVGTTALVAVPITDPIPVPAINKETMREAIININNPPKILEFGGPNWINMYTGQPDVVITNIAFDRNKIAFDIENRMTYSNSNQYNGNTYKLHDIWIDIGFSGSGAGSTIVGKFSTKIPPGEKFRAEIKFEDFSENARNLIDTARISFQPAGYKLYTFS